MSPTSEPARFVAVLATLISLRAVSLRAASVPMLLSASATRNRNALWRLRVSAASGGHSATVACGSAID